MDRKNPDLLQDVCVADYSSGVKVNGFACKPTFNSSDFFFDGLANPGLPNNPMGSKVTPANVKKKKKKQNKQTKSQGSTPLESLSLLLLYHIRQQRFHRRAASSEAKDTMLKLDLSSPSSHLPRQTHHPYNTFFDGAASELSSRGAVLRLRFYDHDAKCVVCLTAKSVLVDGVSRVEGEGEEMDPCSATTARSCACTVSSSCFSLGYPLPALPPYFPRRRARSLPSAPPLQHMADLQIRTSRWTSASAPCFPPLAHLCLLAHPYTCVGAEPAGSLTAAPHLPYSAASSTSLSPQSWTPHMPSKYTDSPPHPFALPFFALPTASESSTEQTQWCLGELLNLSNARKDPEDYWKKVMKGEPMPKAIEELVHGNSVASEKKWEASSHEAINVAHFKKDFDTRPIAIIYHRHDETKKAKPLVKDLNLGHGIESQGHKSVVKP
ncbi:hypothetical protein TEA_029162 [Camellia sinensis var. sinensis]|uniref:Uncharacterized protein n=1 Tax=Camellia sinensis var. sinensis TaxID=542762 RepID=A0A4V3WJM0_CAMSN|nr:hypothetical protein TEA_029162 [Camellia sinensis var. sinensis]